MSKSSGRSAEYKLGGMVCTTAVELADAICADWSAAREHLKRGYLGRWIEEALRDFDLKIKLDSQLEDEIDLDLVLFQVVVALDPARDGCYRGVCLTREGLFDFLSEDREDEDEIICEIHRYDLLTKLENDDSILLGNLADAWHKEIHAFFRARTDVLKYKAAWEDHPDLIGNVLDGTEADAMFMMGTRDDNEFEYVVRHVYHEIKAVLLFKILDTQLGIEASLRSTGSENTSDKRSGLVPESFQTQAYSAEQRAEDQGNARKREWVKAYFDDGESSLGRFFVDRDVGKRVALFVVQKTRDLRNFEKSTSAAGADPFSKRMKLRHAVLGVGTFLGSLLFAYFGPYFLLWQGAFVAAAMPFFVFFAPFSKKLSKPNDFFVAVILAVLCGAFVSGVARSVLSSEFTFILYLFLAGAATAGASIANAIRSRGRRREKLEKLLAEIKGSADVLDREGVAGYIYKLVNNESSNASNSNRGNAGHADFRRLSTNSPTSSSSRPAASHGDGFSTQWGNQRIASDGTVTTDLTDNMSIDSRGKINTKVLDNVTLHSDGTRTTKLFDGMEIRSDGQVSTELFGVRISSGGKEKDKKKSLLDW